MRIRAIAAATLLALAFAAGAYAQQATGSWAGVNPRNITFQPIDTSRAMRPGATDRAFRAPGQMRTTGIDRFFPKLNIATWPPKVANVFVLPQSSNQFQPNVPKGYNPFGQPK